MQLVKYRMPTGVQVGFVERGQVVPLALAAGQFRTLSDVLEADDPVATATFLADRSARPTPLAEAKLLAPIDAQEVWAAGVTYRRSRTARMEESRQAASFYDLVYEAPRPELFFKASTHRVVGPAQSIRIRSDSRWSVPEPELALVLNSRLALVGYTIGNDVSARDIEGENPLYLPQAKVYDACCALGPAITLATAFPPLEEVSIRLLIRRASTVAFEGAVAATEIVRSFDELIGWLGRDNRFPHGAFLLTGTGIVPRNDFALAAGDTVEITIDGIGTLANSVVQG